MTTALWALADYNGVIGRQPLPSDWAHLAHIAGWHQKSLPAFQERFWDQRPDFDRGEITGEDFWARMGCPTADRGQALRADTAMWLRTDRQILDLLRAARHRGVKLALLSNAPHEVARAIEQASWAAEFDILRFSCDLRANKPDPEAYESTLQDMGVIEDRSQVLFIDDRLDNTTAATELGLSAHHFTGDSTALSHALSRHRRPLSAAPQGAAAGLEADRSRP